MRRVIAAVLIALSTQGFSQGFENLMARKMIECPDISYSSSVYFAKFMEENKLDSALGLLNYWRIKCGNREPVYRSGILYALKTGQFHDSLLTEGTLNNLFNYLNRMEMIRYSKYHSYDNYESYYGYVPPGQEFDVYTQRLAAELKRKYPPKSMEYLLAEFYSDNTDSILKKIQNRTFKGCRLNEQYESLVNSYVNMPEVHVALATGIWIPSGKLSKIGVHPEVGGQIGAKHRKMNYDVVMAVRFGNAATPYYAKRTKSNDSLELTDHFLGGHFGFDAGRDIYYRNGHEVQVVAGIGLDGFDALKEDKARNLEAESTWTYDLSLGASYRYYLTNTFYIGFRAKYHFVNYALTNVVSFSGNPVTLQLTFGGVNNEFRNKRLRELNYLLRR